MSLHHRNPTTSEPQSTPTPTTKSQSVTTNSNHIHQNFYITIVFTSFESSHAAANHRRIARYRCDLIPEIPPHHNNHNTNRVYQLDIYSLVIITELQRIYGKSSTANVKGRQSSFAAVTLKQELTYSGTGGRNRSKKVVIVFKLPRGNSACNYSAQSQRGKGATCVYREKFLLVEAQDQVKFDKEEIGIFGRPWKLSEGSAKAFLMANLSGYGSDVLSEFADFEKEINYLKQTLSEQSKEFFDDSKCSVNGILFAYDESVHYVEMCTSVQLEAERIKQHNMGLKKMSIKTFKRFTEHEQHCISLEIAMQLNKDFFQKNNTSVNQIGPSFDQLFKLNNLKAELQAKDTTIEKLKANIKLHQYSDLLLNIQLIQEFLGHVIDTCPDIHKPSEKLVDVTRINMRKIVSFMFDARHELCFLEFVFDINASSKSKSVKKAKMKEVWKPTRKVFTKIGYKWKPTGRTFTLVENACPLTRITTTNKVPLRELVPLEVIAQESVVRDLSKLMSSSLLQLRCGSSSVEKLQLL
ncbi:hypothetical protein Tco_0628078 [Tanacetum coccineum]|uniref:Uncharacterized protein n=1 Tax=Tanacetum coccineum TaxID=301880 RepID=A0ABQ4WP88_9ASTR